MELSQDEFVSLESAQNHSDWDVENVTHLNPLVELGGVNYIFILSFLMGQQFFSFYDRRKYDRRGSESHVSVEMYSGIFFRWPQFSGLICITCQLQYSLRL